MIYFFHYVQLNTLDLTLRTPKCGKKMADCLGPFRPKEWQSSKFPEFAFLLHTSQTRSGGNKNAPTKACPLPSGQQQRGSLAGQKCLENNCFIVAEHHRNNCGHPHQQRLSGQPKHSPSQVQRGSSNPVLGGVREGGVGSWNVYLGQAVMGSFLIRDFQPYWTLIPDF